MEELRDNCPCGSWQAEAEAKQMGFACSQSPSIYLLTRNSLLPPSPDSAPSAPSTSSPHLHARDPPLRRRSRRLAAAAAAAGQARADLPLAPSLDFSPEALPDFPERKRRFLDFDQFWGGAGGGGDGGELIRGCRDRGRWGAARERRSGPAA